MSLSGLQGGLHGTKTTYEAIRKATTVELGEVLEWDRKHWEYLNRQTIFHYVSGNSTLWFWIVLCAALLWDGGPLAVYGIPAVVIGLLIYAERTKRSELESLVDKSRAIESELAERAKNH